MKKVIIFGVGYCYKKYREDLSEKFDILACTSNCDEDRNFTKDKYISPSEINCYEYDYIVVCTDSDYQIFAQLVNELKVPPYKIRIYREVLKVNGLFNSEQYEDAISLILLQKIVGKLDDCFYIDLGTNHPIIGNNTYMLYQLGAKGVCVEANPELTDFINFVRPRDEVINKAITLDGTEAILYRTKKIGHSTLRINDIERDVVQNSDLWDVENSYAVCGITINDLIKSITNNVDLMSIDLEGMDMLILQQIDFSQFRPSIVIVENEPCVFRQYVKKDFDMFFKGNGYVLFHQTAYNGIYVDEKYRDLLRNLFVVENN